MDIAEMIDNQKATIVDHENAVILAVYTIGQMTGEAREMKKEIAYLQGKLEISIKRAEKLRSQRDEALTTGTVTP